MSANGKHLLGPQLLVIDKGGSLNQFISHQGVRNYFLAAANLCACGGVVLSSFFVANGNIIVEKCRPIFKDFHFVLLANDFMSSLLLPPHSIIQGFGKACEAAYPRQLSPYFCPPSLGAS